MKNEQKQLEYEATEVLELLEDMVEYVCKEHMISGEKSIFYDTRIKSNKVTTIP